MESTNRLLQAPAIDFYVEYDGSYFEINNNDGFSVNDCTKDNYYNLVVHDDTLEDFAGKSSLIKN